MAEPRRLTGERITAAALAIIDRDGLQALSARSLAAALGVQPMAVYHHLAGMEGVLDSVLDAVLSGIDLPDRTGDFRADLLALNRAYVAALLRHPNAIPLLAGRRFNSAASLPVLEAIFAVLADAGLPPEQIAEAFRIQGYFINGALMALAATRHAAARPDFHLESDPLLAGHPLVAAVLPHLRIDRLEPILEAGLDLILDGLQRRYLAPDPE